MFLKAHYHKKCHAAYVKPTKLKSDDANILYDKAFENFATYFEKIMKDGKALRMHTTAFQKYQQNLTDVGVKDEDAARYTNAKLKARILKRYGNSVRFADQKHKNEPQVVYSSDVDIKELINFANEYKKALDDDSLVERDDNTMQVIVKDEKVKILRYAAKVLKQEIEKVNGIETLPLNPDDISLAAMKKVVPEHLKHFLHCLCGASEHKLLKILSIAQSIIFVSSDLQKKMPKQVGLGESLKACLRSREYIILLNKFGEV